jgi:hypothetical protein
MQKAFLLLGWALAACESSGPADPTERDTGMASQSDDAGFTASEPTQPDAGPSPEARKSDADAAADATSEASADAAVPDAAARVVCNVQAPTACPEPAPRYADVAPVFTQRCVVCHSPMWTGPWPLDEYGHLADWQSDIRSHLLDCTMPPPDAGIPLPEEESLLILTWLRCGLPQ